MVARHGHQSREIAGLPGGYIEIQIVDGTTLYGTNSHGIFRLTHGSDSWERIAPIQRIVRSLALDRTTLYIGTAAEGVFRLSLDEYINRQRKCYLYLTMHTNPTTAQFWIEKVPRSVERRFSHKCGVTFSASELARSHGQDSPSRIHGKKPPSSQILRSLLFLAK